MRRVVCAVLAACLLAACTPPSPTGDLVTVEGPPDAAPTIAFDAPLEITESKHSTLWEGTGPRLLPDEPVLIHYRLEDATSGDLIEETYGGLPKAFVLAPESISLDLYRALTGENVGARVLVLVAAAPDGAAPAVLVADALPTRATGTEVQPRDDLPQVRLDESGAPSVTIPDADPPAELAVQTLIRGTGDQVADGDNISVQYTGWRWSDGTVFDSTWEEHGPTAFALNEAIPGWSDGLVEQTVGSQVLLVVPPALAYGSDPDNELVDETLVFVVDILAATGQED